MKIHIGHHFFGAGNLGDDLMMAGFIKVWLKRGISGTLSCNTPFERTVQKVRFPQIDWLSYSLEARTEAIRNCNVWLGLGGSAFQTDSGTWLIEHMAIELELCKRFRKPMFYLCVDVGNWEALNDPVNIAVLEYVEHVWTRDETAAKRIRSVSQENKITAGADLSHLYLAKQNWPVSCKSSLAWLITNFNGTVALQEITQAIDTLLQWQHHWLIQEVRELQGSELEILHTLPFTTRNKLNVGLPNYCSLSTDQLLENWPNCEAVITSRFHGALIAGWRGARVAIIERNDKLSGLADTLGCISISEDYDATVLCRTITSSAIIQRDILEQQFDIAMNCCNDFFDVLQQRYFVGRLDA
jgi:hypothetical protein